MQLCPAAKKIDGINKFGRQQSPEPKKPKLHLIRGQLGIFVLHQEKFTALQNLGGSRVQGLKNTQSRVYKTTDPSNLRVARQLCPQQKKIDGINKFRRQQSPESKSQSSILSEGSQVALSRTRKIYGIAEFWRQQSPGSEKTTAPFNLRVAARKIYDI